MDSLGISKVIGEEVPCRSLVVGGYTEFDEGEAFVGCSGGGAAGEK